MSELPSASRKSTRQRKRVSLDGFLMTGYNREASSEDHSSLSIKKAKIESIGCKEDPENTDIEETSKLCFTLICRERVIKNP